MDAPWWPSWAIQTEFGCQGYADVHAVITEEIPLDEDLFRHLSKRRKHLRELREATQSTLRLDRARGCLSVTGTGSSISEVKQSLTSLGGGVRHKVGAPVWAELLRTRTVRRDEAALARIQAESGCRVHIDRRQREVRIFGPVDSVVLAESLLKELEEQCCQDVVLVWESLDTETDVERLQASLEPLAKDHSVTLCIDKNLGLRVFGIKAAVKAASTELKELVEPQGLLGLEDRLRRRSLLNTSQEGIGVVLSHGSPVMATT